MLTKLYSYRTDPNFLSSWKVSAEKLAALCDSKEVLETPGNWVDGKPSSVDSICVPICNALNLLPHLRTTSSCQGHGDSYFYVQFNCSEMATLHFLVNVFGGGVLVKRDDGGTIEFCDWDIKIVNWSLITMRAFENVTFCLSSDSLGKEKHDGIKMEVVMSYAEFIAKKAREYAEQLEDAYRRRNEPTPDLAVPPALPESESAVEVCP